MAILAIAIAAALAGEGAAPTVVRLRPKASARGTEVAGPRAGELGRLRLGYAPSPGHERALEAAVVEGKLRAAGLARSELRVEGRLCVVSVETVSVEGQEVERKVLEELRRRIPATAVVELQGEAPDLVSPRPRGEGLPDLEIVPRGELRGRLPVDVHAVAQGERIATATLGVLIRIEEEVLVARAALVKGEPADSTRVELRRADVTSLRGEPLRDPGALAGRIVARAVAENAVLVAEDLALPSMYRKGDQARLVIRRTGIRIDALVRVDADAVIGSRVPVTCLEFGKQLVALLREDGTFELMALGLSAGRNR
jgi:flagella basal body P-ring formation protein FlgA